MPIQTKNYYELHQSFKSNLLSDPFAEKIPQACPDVFFVASYSLAKRVCNRRNARLA